MDDLGVVPHERKAEEGEAAGHEEAGLQLATTEPNPVIGRHAFGDGKICAIPLTTMLCEV